MIEGTTLNQAKLTENIDRSVMMVTALSPVIGYDKTAAISYYAIDHNQTLKQAALANEVSEEPYDRVIDPLALTRPGPADAAPGPPDITAPKPRDSGTAAHLANQFIVGKAVLLEPCRDLVDISRIRQHPRRLIS